ncbi:MAG: dockerin type I domain-containing protein [Planctomycetota bacterium]
MVRRYYIPHIPGSTEVYIHNFREPYNAATGRFIDSGFWPIIGISAAADVESYYYDESAGTAYKKNVHLAALRLNDFLSYACCTYIGEMEDDQNNPVTLTSVSFTPGFTQNYLVMASCKVGTQFVNSYATAWLDIDGVTYDYMNYNILEDLNDRVTFVGMRRVNLDTSQHTLSLKFCSTGGVFTKAANGSIIVIPLDYALSEYTDKSNVVETCTAAAVPFMANTSGTFTGRTNESITVQVGSNGNPADTGIELWYAIGDENGNTAALTKWNGTLTSGYSWDVTGLDANTSYWFMSRAENWSGCFTDFCNITVWSTLPGTPVLSCTDCTSDSLAWQWTDSGGDGFTIFDNDTDLAIVSEIPGGVTGTVETGLEPNTTYSRYLKTYLFGDALTYYYNENLPGISTTLTAFQDVCTLSLSGAPEGNYFIIASMQVASSTTTDIRSEFQLIDESSNVVGIQNVWTDTFFFSFMASESRYLDGTGSPEYKLQARSVSGGYDTDTRNAAIIAVKLPSNNYNTLDNSTDGDTLSILYDNHSVMTVTPPGSGDDYMLIHTSNLNHTSVSYQSHSRLRRLTPTERTFTEAAREPRSAFSWITQGGFGILKDISSDIVFAHQFHRDVSGTAHSKNVHIAAVRLNETIWQGYSENSYEGEQSTTGDTPVTALELSFNAPKQQKYLVMTSASIGGDVVGPHVWWEYECSSGITVYDYMYYGLVEDINDRMTFSGIRRLDLAPGDHTVRIIYRHQNSSWDAHIDNPAIIVLPLEGTMKEYTDPSNIVETCTAAAVPYMDNSAATFTDRGSDYIDVTVDNASNPGGTPIELWYCPDDGNNQPNGVWASAGTNTTDYAWTVDGGIGLAGDTSYWFRARARNWPGSWSDYCNVTVCKTLPGPPVLSCTDCTSNSLTWSWLGGGDGFTIFDNDTDLPVTSEIPGGETTTVETGLDVNATYRRYIKAYNIGTPLTYYYAENLSEVSTTSSAVWENVCTLDINLPEAGNYLVLCSDQINRSSGYEIEIQLVRDETNRVLYARERTEGYYRSYLASEILTASGSDSYKYQLQVKCSGVGGTSYSRNAAIMAVKLPVNSHNYVNNASDGSHDLETYQNHSILTVTPPGISDNYFLVHSGMSRSSYVHVHQARLYRFDTAKALTSVGREHVATTTFGTSLGGFSILNGLSEDVALADQFRINSPGYTNYRNSVNITALRLNNPAWSGYAGNAFDGEASTQNIGGVPVVTRTFTVTVAQEYLIMASCGVGIDITSSSYRPTAWLEHECASGTTALDSLEFFAEDVDDRMQFAAIRRLNLAAGSHTIRIKLQTNDGSRTVYATYPAVIAIPLEGNVPEYADRSNVVEVCTAALVPFMANASTTFTVVGNTSISAVVGPNGNPAGTNMELFWAVDSGGAPGSWVSAGAKSSAYLWTISSLDPGTTYWFRARAENWRGCYTDYCNETVCRTMPDPPILYSPGCTSDSLTWAWISDGGNGFIIYDNSNDFPLITGIPYNAVQTIETGLDPNTTYTRYMKASVPTDNVYYYSECLDVVQVQSPDFGNACVLSMYTPPAGQYMVIAAMMAKSSGATEEIEVRFRHHNGSSWSTIQEALWIPYQKYSSFMGTDIFTSDGISTFTYTMEFRNASTGYWSYAQNASILAMKLPTSNYSYLENTTEEFTSSETPVTHSTLTVTPPNPSDYLLIHAAAFRGNSGFYTPVSGFNVPSPNAVFQSSMRQPDTFHRYPHGGFWPWAGVANPTVVTHQYWMPGTTDNGVFKKNVVMAGFRLSDSVWDGYACNSYADTIATINTTGVDLVSVTFTPSTAQNYLILASGMMGFEEDSSVVNSYYGQAWLEIDGVACDRMSFDEGDPDYRIPFAAIRRVSLDTSSHTIKIRIRTMTVNWNVYGSNAAIIALPLDGEGALAYTNKSNVVETCTAALVPFMDNSSATFTDRTNSSITVSVGPNGNPAGTPIELWIAEGDENGNTMAFAQWDLDQTSGYSWMVTGLEANRSYWFQARAENWRGCFTDFCNVTVWSTFPGAPDNFNCFDCTSATLSWEWDGRGGDGYEILDNATGSVVIASISAGSTFTIETGLSPNTTYARLIRSFQTANGPDDFAATWSGYFDPTYGRATGLIIFGNETFWGEPFLYGAAKFNISALPPDISISSAILYFEVAFANIDANAKFDITGVSSDPATDAPATLINEIQTGTVYVNDNNSHQSTGFKNLALASSSHSWIGSCVPQGWCALGFNEVGTTADGKYAIVASYTSNPPSRPYLRIDYTGTFYSSNSSAVETCTAANVPMMDNSALTFTLANSNTIVANVGLNSNPGGTTMELFYARGNSSQPTESYSSAGTKTSSYSWDVIGLLPETSYWFQARAYNWRGCLTDNCAVTVWSTDAGPFDAPAGFTCIGCTSTTLTWQWSNVSGEEGYQILDNVSGLLMVDDIGADNTSTIETGLSENTYYVRTVRAFKDSKTTFSDNSTSDAAYTLCEPPLDAELAILSYDNDSITCLLLTCPNFSMGCTAAYFQCTLGGGSDSGWLDSGSLYNATHIDHIDNGLSPNVTYGYQARYRNGDGIPTAYNTPVEVCTLANIPAMNNDSNTFPGETGTSITVNVRLSGNPDGTAMELFYASGTPAQPTGPWLSAGWLSSGYTWIVDNSGQGLISNTSYWFKARARNHGNEYTGNCSLTVWSTLAGSLPGAFNLLKPASGATVRNTEALLSWECASDADGYHIFISDSDPPSYCSSATGTTYCTNVMTDEKMYYWKIVAYNASGNTSSTTRSFYISVPDKLAWAKSANGSNYNYGYDISVLPDNHIIITGAFSTSATFGQLEDNETILTTSGGYDAYIAKYNPDGTLSWARKDGGFNTEYSKCISLLSDGSIVIAGYFHTSSTFGLGDDNETDLTSAGDYDIFIACYNSNKSLTWVTQAGGTSGDAVDDITALSDDSIIITGGFSSTVVFGAGEANETTLDPIGSSDIYLAKYNSLGNLVWATQAGGSDSEAGRCVDAMPGDFILITGFFIGTTTFGIGEANEADITATGSNDIFIARYNSLGNLTWVRQAGSSSPDGGYGVSAFDDGSFLSTGFFGGTATFGEGEGNETQLVTTGDGDVFIAKYNGNGSLLWVSRANGNVDKNDFGLDVEALPDGTGLLMGDYYSTELVFGQGEDNESVIGSSGGKNVFVAKYSPVGTLLWVKRAGGTGLDAANDVAAMPDGSAILIGNYDVNMTFGFGETNETTLINTSGKDDIFLTRYGELPPTDPPPTEPDGLKVKGLVNPTAIGDNNSVTFSATYRDTGPVSNANAAWIQVDNDSDFSSLHDDTGWFGISGTPPNTRCSAIPYTGPALTANVTYYWQIKFRNKDGQESPFSTQEAYFATAFYTQDLPYKGYHLLYLQCNTGGKTFQQLFGDDINGGLVIYCWNELLNQWDSVGANTAPLDNMGYIIYAYKATTLGINGDSYDGDGTTELTFDVTCSGDNEVAYWGYNLVRNPFTSDISWSSCDLQNCETTHWRPWDKFKYEYEWYNTSGPSASECGSNTIPGGASFWVHCIGNNAYVTMYDPGGAPQKLLPPALQWRLPIRTRTGTYSDTSTYAAVCEHAAFAYDTYDVVEIRPFAYDYIQAYFSHPEWGRFRGPYTQDTRSFPGLGGTVTWKMTVYATDADGFVYLSWEVPELQRDYWRFYFRDDASGIVKDMAVFDAYDYPASGKDTRTFTLTATCFGTQKLGDTNLDGEVTPEDAALCARAEHGFETLTPEQQYVSDLNSDGKVDIFDALLILRRINGHLPGNP